MAEILSPFKMSPEKIRDIRRRVKDNDDEATFVVHPLYRFLTINSTYLFSLQRVLTEELNRNGLILWFEDKNNPTLALVPPIAGGVVLNIPTERDDPKTVYDPDTMDPSVKDPEVRDKVLWDRIKELGVTKGRLAGRMLNYIDIKEDLERGPVFSSWSSLVNQSRDKPETQKWLGQGLYPYGCPASVAIKCIRRGIDISPTEATSPNDTFQFDDPIIQRLLIATGFSAKS